MSSEAEAFIPWIPVLGGLLAALCLGFALRSGRRHRLVSNLPTSKTTGVFIGLVELKGTAEVETPLHSYLAEIPCVHYAWTVQEQWRRVRTETYTDSKGNRRTRTRVETGWTTVGSGGEMIPFYLRDDEGAVLVQPEGAELHTATVFRRTCGTFDPLYYAKGPAAAIWDSTHTRRFVEEAIPLHAPLYIMGQSRERSDVVAPEIAADKDAPMFLISTKSEEQVVARLRGGFWGLNILGGVLLVGAFVLKDHLLGRPLGNLWHWYVLAAAGFFSVAATGWVWMVFNSLVDLRHRVRQGWSQVEVQLKRRHDLIPNLVATVTAMRDYERTVQTEVAEMRTQQAATAPGVAGPDFHSLQPALMAIAEAYPELTAQESFAALQQELVNTEQRIALARGYFNEIATFYNTRLEVIPDRFIAALGRMKPQPLMLADEFQRAPVEVHFSEEPVLSLPPPETTTADPSSQS